MIWTLKISDIVSFENEPYKYEVKDVYKDYAIIENILTHIQSEIKISIIKEKAKIERRSD